MGKIEALFRVVDDIDPEVTDPMELIDQILESDDRLDYVELISAEWVE